MVLQLSYGMSCAGFYGRKFMKYSHYDIQHLQEQSKGLRTFLLFVVVAIIVVVAVFSAKRYWKVSVSVEPEPVREVAPEQ